MILLIQIQLHLVSLGCYQLPLTLLVLLGCYRGFTSCLYHPWYCWSDTTGLPVACITHGITGVIPGGLPVVCITPTVNGMLLGDMSCLYHPWCYWGDTGGGEGLALTSWYHPRSLEYYIVCDYLCSHTVVRNSCKMNEISSFPKLQKDLITSVCCS